MASIFSNLAGLFTGEPVEKAEEQARLARAAGFSDASKYLTEGTQKADTFFNTATGRWEELKPTAMGGYSAYADASGANGPEGLARARAAFESSGGYGLGLNQSNDEIMRRFAGSGLTSNNVNAVARNTGDVLQKGYFQYADKLAPWMQQANAIATGQSGIDVGRGQLWQGMGKQLGDWRTGQATADATGYGKIGEVQMAAGKNVFEGIMGALKLAGNLMAPTPKVPGAPVG